MSSQSPGNPPQNGKIKVESINFPNGNQASIVRPSSAAKPQEIVSALGIDAPNALILINGGANNIDEKVTPLLIQLFSRGIAKAAAGVKALIIDGGTDAGVMAMMGQAVADRGNKSKLIGMAPAGLVTYPGAKSAEGVQLEPNHSHFVLAEGNTWGSELNTMYKVASVFAEKAPAVVIVASGGQNSKNEVLHAVRQNLPIIVVAESGGLADEIVENWKARPALPADPVMAEIVADGKIYVHLLTNSVKGMERLIIRELGGDNVLLQAWEHFADYDLNAKIQQKRATALQKWILILGVAITALALIPQTTVTSVTPGSPPVATPSWWNPTVSTSPAGMIVGWLKWILIALPIFLTILITASGRFKQSNKWLLLRAGAEAIKREIYKYRARASNYDESPGKPSAAEQLSQKVEDITRRTMKTEVNTSALVAYDKDKGFPPYMYAAKGGDDGFTTLTPDRYVEVRLEDQINYFKKTAMKLERELKIAQWSIYIAGGVGTFLAAIEKQVLIALTTSMTTAMTTYLSFRQTESSLTKYNQAKTDLENVRAWWTALSAEDQSQQANVDTLVEHTEQVLQSELDGWVQQMQNSLEQLRKDQTTGQRKDQPVDEQEPDDQEGGSTNGKKPPAENPASGSGPASQPSNSAPEGEKKKDPPDIVDPPSKDDDTKKDDNTDTGTP